MLKLTIQPNKSHGQIEALPVRGPRIEILDANGRAKSPKAQEISYAVGDKIELRCNSAPSKPAARLRWFLNDHELTIPNNGSTSESSFSTNQRATTASTGVEQRMSKPYKYDVKVSPIEYRQHYKGIYSSHSSLSLILQKDDLINSKISFKCLASMRQEVPVNSKQLIVLTPQLTTSAANKIRRAKREPEQPRFVEAESSDLEPPSTHRKHNRHKVSRMQQSASTRSQAIAKNSLMNDVIQTQGDDNRSRMLYVYEDSDSTLGPSIIDKPETLENYLRAMMNSSSLTNKNNNYIFEFNKADNTEFVQSIRDRIARQRSLPASQAGSSIGSSHKRLHGINTLVKSPLHLDENDPLRPIISWPPIPSGSLLLLPPGDNIVAVPTQNTDTRQSVEEVRFIPPPKSDTTVSDVDAFRSRGGLQSEQETKSSLHLLEQLVQNMNCVCADSSPDTKLGWIINDNALNVRDTRFYPARTSPDHRQTLLTIGFQMPKSSYQASSLRSILSQYKAVSDASIPSKLLDSPTHGSVESRQTGSNRIRFTCQAIHSLLLYSSSEMITFDFNPVSLLDTGNSIDKYPSLSNNVIHPASGKFVNLMT